MPATQEDATLLMQILQWGSSIGIGDAFAYIHSDDFDPKNADPHNPQVRTALGFYEVVGTFVKQRLLDRDLVHDLWALEPAWDRLSSAALKAREQSGIPRMFENFELLVKGAPVPVGV
ncbi:MAG TPA: hypothetical protein VJU79_07595 [Candidatus Dormibacteraeota bacterium]|nr:hypothetical protein [Candidatus Dormibacteraeota bacterium]